LHEGTSMPCNSYIACHVSVTPGSLTSRL
jgi:hypothetical protein